MESYKEKFKRYFPFIIRWRDKAKEVSLPGFEGVPIYYVIHFFIKEIQRDTISVRASSIAFNFFLAIFPAIIFFFTLIPYIPIDGLQENLNQIIKELMPANAYSLIQDTITGIINRPRSGLLSVGFIAAIYFATNGVAAIMEAFDKILSNFERRNFLHQRFIALKLTLILSLLLILTLVLIIGGNWIVDEILNYVQIKSFWAIGFLTGLKWFLIVFLLFNAISFIYYFGPATKRKWKFISVGSTLATVLTLLISLGFSYFINNFGQYNKLYGSIGSIAVFMVWMYLNSFALIIGFELNASIDFNKYKNLEESETEEFSETPKQGVSS